jgi:hypothetical protein
LLEPERSNLITYSEDFSQWTKLNGGTGSLPIVTSNNTISPNGTQNADKIVLNKGNATSNSDYSLIRLDYGGSDVDGTASVYLKSDVNVDVEISSDDISYQTISVTTNWKRFEVSDATSDRLSIGLRGTEPSTSNATVYAWGAQLEVGSYATSYIPTSGSAVTRVADSCNNGANRQVINSTEGVLYFEGSVLDISTPNSWISVSQNSSYNNNQFNLRFVEDSNIIQAVSRAGGLGQDVVLQYTLSDKTTINKIAIKYKLNDWALWVNGIEVDTETSSNAFTPSSLDVLDFDRGNNSNNFYGNVKDLRVYNTALTDAELQALTQ